MKSALSEVVNLRVTKAQQDEIDMITQAEGMSQSSWMRHLIHEKAEAIRLAATPLHACMRHASLVMDLWRVCQAHPEQLPLQAASLRRTLQALHRTIPQVLGELVRVEQRGRDTAPPL